MSSPYPGDVGDWQQANAVFTDPALAPHRPFFAGLRGLSLPEQNSRLAPRPGQHHRPSAPVPSQRGRQRLTDVLRRAVRPRARAVERAGLRAPERDPAALPRALRRPRGPRARRAPRADRAVPRFRPCSLRPPRDRGRLSAHADPDRAVLAWFVAATYATYVRVRRGTLTTVGAAADERAMPQSRIPRRFRTRSGWACNRPGARHERAAGRDPGRRVGGPDGRLHAAGARRASGRRPSARSASAVTLDRGRRLRLRLRAAHPVRRRARDRRPDPRLLGENFTAQSREAYIYHASGIYTRFPFQAHLHGLPTEVVVDCLSSLVAAIERDARGEFNRATTRTGCAAASATRLPSG